MPIVSALAVASDCVESTVADLGPHDLQMLDVIRSHANVLMFVDDMSYDRLMQLLEGGAKTSNAL